MGHYARGSHTVIPVVECPVHSDKGNRVAFALRDHLIRAGIGAAGTSRTGILRHLLVRTSQDDRQSVAMLVVSQFTLYADAKKGRRPAFINAARPETAEPLVDAFADELRRLGMRVGQGKFGAEMQVGLVNDGPVTIWLDTAELRS